MTLRKELGVCSAVSFQLQVLPRCAFPLLWPENQRRTDCLERRAETPGPVRIGPTGADDEGDGNGSLGLGLVKGL